MKVIVHMCINTAGVAEVDVLSPTEIKVELKNFLDNASFYIDQNENQKLGMQMQSMTALSVGQVIADALKHKMDEAVQQVSHDITLAMTPKEGKA